MTISIKKDVGIPLGSKWDVALEKGQKEALGVKKLCTLSTWIGKEEKI